MVKKYDLETSPELRYIDLTSEMGELGKELLKGSNYGKQDFNKTNIVFTFSIHFLTKMIKGVIKIVNP